MIVIHYSHESETPNRIFGLQRQGKQKICSEDWPGGQPLSINQTVNEKSEKQEFKKNSKQGKVSFSSLTIINERLLTLCPVNIGL